VGAVGETLQPLHRVACGFGHVRQGGCQVVQLPHGRWPDDRRDEREHGDEKEIDEEDADEPWHPDALETVHQRVEHQGDEPGQQEDEDHLADGREGEPGEQQEHREHRELHPPGDEDLSRTALRSRGHAAESPRK